MSRGPTARLRHDLRTPLNHLIGYTEMLLEEVDLPELRTVLQEGKTILPLVNDFLASPENSAEAPDLAVLHRSLASHLSSVRALASSARERTPTELLPDLDRITAAVAELDALLGGGAAPAAAESPAPSTEPSHGQATLLVVDDHKENRRLLARRLEREGYRVEVAEGGERALQLLETTPIDLVLLDVMMPDIDGLEVLRRIKSNPRHQGLPVLMISALDELDTVVRSIELGAEDYLPKPFEVVVLRARIGACLEKKRLREREHLYQREIEEWNQTLELRVREQVALLERLSGLKRFVSPQLAELIVRGDSDDPLRTHRREITVVFLDLHGFTAFAETSEPEEVMSVLREYHTEMGRLVQSHEGTLERFTGDGLMVFFNDPVLVPDPAERAVAMALAMRERVAALQAGWGKRGYDLALGVGVAQGYATIGAIGFDTRWDYAAIGTVTKLAARLCAEASGGQILISSKVAAAVESQTELEPLGSLHLRGFVRPITTYAVAAGA